SLSTPTPPDVRLINLHPTRLPCRSARLLRPGWLANRSSLDGARERRLVAREGLEPSKPLGRQIYSLLRLTASLPRRCLFLECVALAITLQPGCCSLQGPLSESYPGRPPVGGSMELAKGFEPPTC